MEPTCERNHRLGNIDAGGRRTALNSSGGDVARARGDFEYAVTSADVGRVQQRINELGGDPAEEVVIASGLLLPSRRFERVERVRVDRATVLPNRLPKLGLDGGGERRAATGLGRACRKRLRLRY